jgi:TPR repeat protein
LLKLTRWFREAVALGNDIAMVSLAEMYEKGLGTVQNLDEAANLYKRAAEKGNATAMLKIGT